jgi:CheY-like chemotaxis protein
MMIIKSKVITLSKARILLVEDAKLNQILAKEIIEQAGLIVDLAENGELALALLREQKYDLVLMDRQMPIMDGVAAAMAIRREFSSKDLPIVAMSAGGGTNERDECLAAGMNDYLIKPIDKEALLTALIRWIPVRQGVNQVKNVLLDNEADIGDLASIPGLDYEIGLYHGMNRVDFYIKLLQSFSESHADAIEQIYTALSEGQLAVAERTAHTLYGVAATVGALDIGKEARQLELAIKEGKGVQELSVPIIKARKKLALLINNIKLVLAKEKNVLLSMSNSQVIKQLEGLEKLLAADLAEAVDAVEAAEDAICAAYGTKGEDLVRTVKNYDFPEALVLVKALLS